MVYNAMKLFMEINPQLFDLCSHDYTELQNTADERQQARARKWERLAEQAKTRKDGQQGTMPSSYNPRGPKINTPVRIDEVDPMTQDSQRKLDALKLQDESNIGRDQRRPRELDRQNSVRPSYALLSYAFLCTSRILMLFQFPHSSEDPRGAPGQPRLERNGSGGGVGTPPVMSRQNSNPNVPRAG